MRQCDHCGAYFKGIPYYLVWLGRVYRGVHVALQDQTCGASA